MEYFCELCDYSTVDRDRIHYHHIVPKSLKGTNKHHNRIYLCGNCHNKIFVTGSKGIHGIKGTNPIIINSKLMSTSGLIIEYIENEETKYKILKNRYC